MTLITVNLMLSVSANETCGIFSDPLYSCHVKMTRASLITCFLFYGNTLMWCHMFCRLVESMNITGRLGFVQKNIEWDECSQKVCCNTFKGHQDGFWYAWIFCWANPFFSPCKISLCAIIIKVWFLSKLVCYILVILITG